MIWRERADMCLFKSIWKSLTLGREKRRDGEVSDREKELEKEVLEWQKVDTQFNLLADSEVFLIQVETGWCFSLDAALRITGKGIALPTGTGTGCVTKSLQRAHYNPCSFSVCFPRSSRKLKYCVLQLRPDHSVVLEPFSAEVSVTTAASSSTATFQFVLTMEDDAKWQHKLILGSQYLAHQRWNWLTFNFTYVISSPTLQSKRLALAPTDLRRWCCTGPHWVYT